MPSSCDSISPGFLPQTQVPIFLCGSFGAARIGGMLFGACLLWWPFGPYENRETNNALTISLS